MKKLIFLVIGLLFVLMSISFAQQQAQMKVHKTGGQIDTYSISDIDSVTFADCSTPDTIPTRCIVAYYPFNGNANDESGNGYNGVVNGAILTTDRKGNNNRAYYFNGLSYIDIPNAVKLPQGNDPRSISVWIYNSSQTNQVIVEWGLVESLKRCILGIADASGFVGFSIYGADLATLVSVRDNKWHNIVLTYDGTTAKMFMDGIYQNSKIMGNLNTSGYNLYFGKNHRGNEEEYNTGSIDDIRIYNCALSDNEIKALFNEN